VTLFYASLVVGLVTLVAVVSPFRRTTGGFADSSIYLWARGILLLAGVRVIVEGERLPPIGRPSFFVGNHQSAMDIPVLLYVLSARARFMAKDSLFRVPVFGYLIRRFGFVPVDRRNVRKTHESVDAMLQFLRRNPVSIVVFPEGTRSVEGKLLPFRKGALKICQRAGLGVVPFAISGSAAVHRRGRFRIDPGVVRVRFAPLIPETEVNAMSVGALHDRVYKAVDAALAVMTVRGPDAASFASSTEAV